MGGRRPEGCTQPQGLCVPLQPGPPTSISVPAYLLGLTVVIGFFSPTLDGSAGPEAVRKEEWFGRSGSRLALLCLA